MYERDRLVTYSINGWEKTLGLTVFLAAFLFSCHTSSQFSDLPHEVIPHPVPDLPSVVELSEGVVIRGSDPRIISFHSFLVRSGFTVQLGKDASGQVVLSVAHDADGRYLVVPYLWEHGDYAERIVLSPTERLIAESLYGIPAELEIRLPGWSRSYQRIVAGPEPQVLFNRSVLNIPFDEETIVTFFHSLRDSVRVPGSLAALYNPLFMGIPVSARVNLFSAEILFGEPMTLSPEEFFLWFYTLREKSAKYDDTFYANLLSLKIAKRLYVGIPSFLGGPSLITRSLETPFEMVSKYLLVPGAIKFSGVVLPYYYTWNGVLPQETTVILPLDEATPVKSFFAASAGSRYSIVSLVLRAADALEKRRTIEEHLRVRGLQPFCELYEQVGDHDAWAAVSVRVEPSREHEIVLLYDTALATVDRTLSIGVYRVGAQER